MNTVVLLTGRDNAAKRFVQQRLPLGAKVELAELKNAYRTRFNCDLIEVSAEDPKTDLPVCVYDGKNVQRVEYRARF